MTKGPTWNDLHQATPGELKRVYKLDEKGLDAAVRKHCNDIPAADCKTRRDFYESVYSSKNKS